MKKIFLYSGLFLGFLGILLIVHQYTKNNFNNDSNEELLGDYINYDEYVFSFDEVTVPDKKLVLYDNSDLDYLRYYVVVFTGDQYIQYAYNFMKNHDQYIDKYQQLASSIVDYNYKELMIKTIDNIDYGTYDEFINNIQDVLVNNMMYIIY